MKWGKLVLDAESKHVSKLQSGMFAVVSKASIKDRRLVLSPYSSVSIQLIKRMIHVQTRFHGLHLAV